MERVWVVESGDYDSRGVDGVAISPEAAVEAIKARHAEYKVKWHEPTKDGESMCLRGDFAFMRGKSTQHTEYFDIRPMELWK